MVPLEHRLDLAGLDPEAADLQLPVGPAEELDVAVRKPAREIAGSVEPRAGAAERTVDEALRGELRTVQIAVRDACAADAELSRDADRYRLEVRVEEVDLGVREGLADRDEAIGQRAAPSASKYVLSIVASVRPYALIKPGLRPADARSTARACPCASLRS